MNELVVPPAPHWYKSSVVACSPDNTLVYGAKNDIVVIKEKNPGEPADVQIIHGAHFKHVTSVSLNRKWKEPHSYVASLGEDNLIKIWDLATFEKKTTNKDHVDHKEAVVGAVFAGDDRVVSATVSGSVIIWNFNSNETKALVDLFKTKVTLTCLSSCPHVGWLVAFGLNNGGVVVADLRRNGQVLYKLRGHYQSVISLSWCPAPVNIFPRSVNNVVKNKSPDVGSSTTESVECQTTAVEGSPQKNKKSNPWANLAGGDDKTSAGSEEPVLTETQDFLKECDALKNKILGLDSEVKGTPTKANSKDEDTKEESTIRNYKVEAVEKHVVQNRPLPEVFDPSGDFFDALQPDFDSTEDRSNAQSSSLEKDSLDNQENVSNEENASSEKEEKKLEFSVGVNETTSVTIEEKASLVVTDNIENEDSTLTVEETDKTNEKKSSPDDSGIVNDADLKQVEEEPRTEYLLASVGKDRTVYIWRAGTDGRMQTFFNASRKPNRRDKNASTWTSLCWATPDTIITSSATGEIIAWTVPKAKESKKQYTVIHYEHSSLVFNIVTPTKYRAVHNWRDKADLRIWTWGQDGKLINCDVTEEKIRYSFTTVTAVVTSFASSPLDPNRLAVGLRDGGIRVWDLSLPHSNDVSMQKYQQKYTHKVSTIMWHPLKEMILGFGTEEGRVGFIDLTSKKTTLFPHYFRNQIYKVEWGPIMGDTSNLGLYIVSEGKVAIYNTQKPEESPAQLDLPSKISAYNFAWKPDFTMFLLNGKDGCLVILNSDLTALNTFYPNEKGLNALVWHPDAFTNQTDISPRCNWFAAATTKGVLVFNCSSIERDDTLTDKVVALFEGHLKPPLAIAWCPFEGNKFVSVAADGLAHVWDVNTKSAIATISVSYMSPHCSVAWSPVEEDLIIIGDKVLRICSISKNPPKTDDEFIANRKRLLAKVGKKDVEKTEKPKIKVDIPTKQKSSPKNCIIPAFYVSNDENISSQVATMRKLMNRDEKEETESDSKIADGFQIFGTKEEVADLLDANYLQQKNDGKYKSCELISLWKGNIGEYIRNAINENRVTPSIVTLAPMVSPKLWHDACLSYAKKLSEEVNSDPLEAATYFLACHKIEEAVNCLCANSMFKEALVLTKHRLPESSEITTKVLEKWATHCTNTGNFENAAYCYIAYKDFENAAKVLSRRNQIEFLEFAAELAEKAGNKGLCDSIKFKSSELQNVQKESGSESQAKTDFPLRIDAVLNSVNENEEEKSDGSSTLENESENGSVDLADNEKQTVST